MQLHQRQLVTEAPESQRSRKVGKRIKISRTRKKGRDKENEKEEDEKMNKGEEEEKRKRGENSMHEKIRSYKELQGKSEQQQTYWSLQGCSVLNLMYKYNTIYQSSPTIKRKLYGSK